MDLTLFTQAKHSFVVHATFIVDNLSQSQALGLVMSILLPISTNHIPSLLRKCEPRARRSIRHIFESSWRQDENEVQSFLSTHQLQSASNRVLVALWREKTVLALCACSRLITLARTCMSHQAAPQEKMLHPSVLIGFGTRHELRNDLMMRTEVPLYLKIQYGRTGFSMVFKNSKLVGN